MITAEKEDALLSAYKKMISEAKYWGKKMHDAAENMDIPESNRCLAYQNIYIHQMEGFLESLRIMGYTITRYDDEYIVEEI